MVVQFPAELPPGKVRNDFRSLECQIMDWADDTAYSLNDIADGIHAGFISLPKLEAWARDQSLSDTDQLHFEFLCKAVSERRVEARLNRCIGDYIRHCTLVKTAGFLSGATHRIDCKGLGLVGKEATQIGRGQQIVAIG